MPSACLNRISEKLQSPVDSICLGIFRVIVGVTFCFHFASYLRNSWVEAFFVAPEFHFKYFCFEWVEALSGDGMRILFRGMFAVSVMVAIGLLYRLSSLMLAFGYTYIFLIDKSQYQNHYYLLMLTTWLLVLLPANASLSVDGLFRRIVRQTSVPLWNLWLIRFQVALPYFFGGVAKVSSDWMHGQPMRMKLANSTWYPFVGSAFTEEWCVQLFVWGGLFFDLLVVPFLLWKRTRLVAYFFALTFHVTNATLFNIGVFPWFMMFATLVFFEPSWIRRFLFIPLRKSVEGPRIPTRWPLRIAMIYVVVQLLLPWRHYFYSGDVNWTEEGHFFAWHMKLRDKKSVCKFRYREIESGRVGDINILRYITPQQASHATGDPEMIVQLCRFLKQKMVQDGVADCEIYALTITSLNGRRPQTLVNSELDLASIPRGAFLPDEVFVPLEEPLRPFNPWRIPRAEWTNHIQVSNHDFWFGAGSPNSSTEPDNAVNDLSTEQSRSAVGDSSTRRLARYSPEAAL